VAATRRVGRATTAAQKLRTLPEKTVRRSYSTLLALTIFHGSLGSPRLGRACLH
jgi:hypothetical protein